RPFIPGMRTSVRTRSNSPVPRVSRAETPSGASVTWYPTCCRCSPRRARIGASSSTIRRCEFSPVMALITLRLDQCGGFLQIESLEMLESPPDPLLEGCFRDSRNLGAELGIVHSIGHGNLRPTHGDAIGSPRSQPVQNPNQRFHIDHAPFEIKNVRA